VQRYAALWEDEIDKNGLGIRNHGRPAHYCARQDQESASLIDLTLANQSIVKWTILAGYHATGSDHEVKEREVGVDRQDEADHEGIVGCNLAAMNEKDAEEAE